MPPADAGSRQHFTIAVRSPFPWTSLLAYFTTRLIEGFETVDAAGYTRVGRNHRVHVGYDETRALLNVASDGLTRVDAATRIEHLFRPQQDVRDAEALLARSPLFASRIARCPGFRPLGCWSAFELCIRTLLGQQVTVVAARTLLRRLIARCGELTPEAVAAAELFLLLPRHERTLKIIS